MHVIMRYNPTTQQVTVADQTIYTDPDEAEFSRELLADRANPATEQYCVAELFAGCDDKPEFRPAADEPPARVETVEPAGAFL